MLSRAGLPRAAPLAVTTGVHATLLEKAGGTRAANGEAPVRALAPAG